MLKVFSLQNFPVMLHSCPLCSFHVPFTFLSFCMYSFHVPLMVYWCPFIVLSFCIDVLSSSFHCAFVFFLFPFVSHSFPMIVLYFADMSFHFAVIACHGSFHVTFTMKKQVKCNFKCWRFFRFRRFLSLCMFIMSFHVPFMLHLVPVKIAKM